MLMPRRALLAVWLLLTSFVLICTNVPGSFAQSLTSVRIASKSAGETMLPYVISQRLGFYREQGLHVDVIVARGAIAAKALFARSVSYTNAGVVPGILSGFPAKIILIDADRPAQYVVSSSKYSSLKELEGKVIAISDYSGNAFLVMRELFNKAGVPMDKMKMRPFGEPGLRLAALMNHLVDATMLAYDYAKRAQERGYKILAYAGDYVTALSGISTLDDQIKESPQEVYKFVKATLQGQLFLYRNPESVRFVMEQLGIRNRSIAEDIWRERVKRGSAIAQRGRASKEAMRENIDRVEEQMRLAGARMELKEPISFKQVYDFSFVKRAYSELEGEGWDPNKYHYVRKR